MTDMNYMNQNNVIRIFADHIFDYDTPDDIIVRTSFTSSVYPFKQPIAPFGKSVDELFILYVAI